MALVETTSYSPHSTINDTEQRSWLLTGLPESQPTTETAQHQSRLHRAEPSSSSDLRSFACKELDNLGNFDNFDALKLSLNDDRSSASTSPSLPKPTVENHVECVPEQAAHEDPSHKLPFQKWMRSLHRRAKRRPAFLKGTESLHWQHSGSQDTDGSSPLRLHHCASPSRSSIGIVSAVRSASTSLASVSAVAHSKRNTIHSRRISRTDRSSKASLSGPRLSEDSAFAESFSLTDHDAIERSLQRRKILEELIATEEGYIGDIRFLINVYVTILATLPTLTPGLRLSINRNLTEIVQLHEEILGELHRLVPHSEYTQVNVQARPSTSASHTNLHIHNHRRWRSLDAVPEHANSSVCVHEVPEMLADPQVAADVSKIFARKMNRFFIYKEYGAKYEMMIKDVASAQRSMPDWESYQRGLEALASTLGSAKNNDHSFKKSLTVSDLLVKPIQRVCKYPLLFAELLKYTPVCDCPNSHMEVESTLSRLREATTEINRATNDTRIKTILERTWLLQDRLVFPHRRIDSATRSQIRSLGHVHLCGALHVCWQTRDGADGQYMICLLYQDALCLAAAGKIEPVYTIMACIDLQDAKVEEVDNGRGLQCHTAPFSWKLVFECDHQLYEIIMTACSHKEEVEWTQQLSRSDEEHRQTRDTMPFSYLDLGLKSLGTVFGKPGTVARRVSIQRATTVGPKSPLCQVILKNTSAVNDNANGSTPALSINRSQSLLTTNARLPVLAPNRSDRVRLEAQLADVWSREALPLPGLGIRHRSDHLLRATTVARKLSVASLTGSFSRRTGSLGQRSKASESVTFADESIKAKESHGDTMRNDSPSIEISKPDEPASSQLPKRRRTTLSKRPNIASFSETTTSCGTVRRLNCSEASGQDSGANIPNTNGLTVLRTSSSNSVVLSTYSGQDAQTPRVLDKENKYQHNEATEQSSFRWAKGGVSRANSKLQTLRSLFR